MRRCIRLHRELVDGWLYWAVLTLAWERTKGDVELSVKAAQKACVWLWDE